MSLKAKKAICEKFGIHNLSSFQEKVIHDLNHGHDVIGLARTGEGKSICYLSQAIVHPNDLLLVITPTISLMRDQVRQCEKSGIQAACLYYDNPDNDAILYQLQKGKIQVLFVSPERLTNHKLRESLQNITIHTVAVDEVHCLIEWGNAFRPMYQKIGKFIRKLHHRPVIAAFSATVPPKDIPFIADSLGMNDCRLHVGKLKRTNLHLKKAFVKTDALRHAKVRKALDKAPAEGRIVIYCTRICDAEDMRDYLIEDCDIPSTEIALCHSKLHDRAKQEERFASGTARIMVATSAFGMGVHIPDIRLVIISQLPFSIPAFYQMAGRAGRDGKKAKVLLLYNGNDYQTNLDIISAKDERAVQAVDDLYAICQSDENLHTSMIDYLCGKVGG